MAPVYAFILWICMIEIKQNPLLQSDVDINFFSFFFFRLLNQRLMEVQAELEDVQENQASSSLASSSEVISMRTKLSEARAKLEEKERQLQHKSDVVEEVNVKATQQADKVSIS